MSQDSQDPQSPLATVIPQPGTVYEKDLIPNGNYISVVPDYPAPEGTKVYYLNGNEFRVYIMISGVWQSVTTFPALLVSVSLSSAAMTLDSGTIPAKKILMAEIYIPANTSGTNPGLCFNGDSGNNYGWTTVGTGGTAGTGATYPTRMSSDFAPGVANAFFADMKIINPSGAYKGMQGQSIEIGSASVSHFWTFYGAWNNTSQITSITLDANNGAHTLPSGTTMSIYGHD